MNELKIGTLNFNLSCSCNSTMYPFGLVWFGECHKKVKDEITGIEVYIANNYEEGKQLEKMLIEKAEIDKIKSFIFSLILKHRSYEDIYVNIKDQLIQNYADGFNDGKHEKAEEIKKVLEI